MFSYRKTSLEKNSAYLNDYVDRIAIPYDDFLEEHILKSDIFSIYINNEPVGFFGKLDGLATIFHVQDKNFNRAGEIFSDIKEKLSVKEAFIPTTDIEFISVAIEHYTKIEIQAYHFMETDRRIRPPEYPREKLRLAMPSDLTEIIAMTGDFLDQHEKRVNEKQLYLLEDKGELIGLGIVVNNLIMKKCKGTGMFSKEGHRRQGIGRSIIIHLRDICHEMNVKPVPGCWYFNVNSKRTLESAGYISKSKLLRFTF